MSNEVNGFWKKCDCVMTQCGFDSDFISYKVALKDNQIFAYNETDGKVTFFPVNKSEFLIEAFRFWDFEHICSFVVDGKWGLFSVDTGAIIIEPVWDFIIYTLGLHYAHVVKKAKLSQESTEKYVTSFFNEYGGLNFHNCGEYLDYLHFCGSVHGALNLIGQVVIPVEYDYLEEVNMLFKSNFIVKKENRMGLLSADNEIIIPFQWENMEYIPLSLRWNQIKDGASFIVSLNQKVGVINIKGVIRIPLNYQRLQLISVPINFHKETPYHSKNCYICFIATAAGKQGIINIENEILMPLEFDLIIPVSIQSPDRQDYEIWLDSEKDMIFCFKTRGEYRSQEEALFSKEKNEYKFGIYDRRLNQIYPVELDGYSKIDVLKLKFENKLGMSAYGIISRDGKYGVIVEDSSYRVKLISKPTLSYNETIALVRKLQSEDFYNAIIDFIKSDISFFKEIAELKKSLGLIDDKLQKVSFDEKFSVYVLKLTEIGKSRLLERNESYIESDIDYLIDILQKQEEDMFLKVVGLKSLLAKNMYLEAIDLLNGLLAMIIIKAKNVWNEDVELTDKNSY